MAVFGTQIGVSKFPGVNLLACGNCVDKFGCPQDVCPDFVIKRHDTKPPFRVEINDCHGVMDLSDPLLVLEINMWANARLKAAISEDDTYFSLADNIGFDQCMVGDIIVMDRVRLAEQMLVVDFDETNKLIEVERGYNSTTISAWNKGNHLKIFRAMNKAAQITLTYEDITKEDGTISNQLTHSNLVYEWDASDTCLPGCYWLEFKLLKMLGTSSSTQCLQTIPVYSCSTAVTETTIPSFSDPSLTSQDYGCVSGTGVDWVRRFPESAGAFLIKIIDSPTGEI